MNARVDKAACLAIFTLMVASPVCAQSRGVYPLGMSATNSGVMGSSGFTYSNQLLFYTRDRSKGDDGETLPQTGSNIVVMDMNSFLWISEKTILGGARYSMSATLPIAHNELTSDVHGQLSGGEGFADSYYLPIILGWTTERLAVRALYGFLAPTGKFHFEAADNVGSGYWTSALSTGQTVYVTRAKRFALSAYEMYEFHTEQSGSGTRPGDTLSIDYSATRAFGAPGGRQIQIGAAGYEQRQITSKTGPTITATQSEERYAVNAIGLAAQMAWPRPRLSLGAKYFWEFANRATYQGFSVQLFGALQF